MIRQPRRARQTDAISFQGAARCLGVVVACGTLLASSASGVGRDAGEGTSPDTTSREETAPSVPQAVMDDAELRPHALRLLTATGAGTRREAADELGDRGARSAAAIPVLIRALDDTDPGVRREVVDSLRDIAVHAGPEAMEASLRAIEPVLSGDSDAGVRGEAIEATRELAEDAPAGLVPPAVRALGRALADSDRRNRRRARRMAAEATSVGPGNPDVRITPVGASREYTELRNAVNGMLERLGEGLRRERRFAAAAAHELRTPLAQIRTTIEVALRRDRPVDEYREALGELLEDTGRLEHLVQGLLELTRSTDAPPVSGHPIHLRDALRRAQAEHLLADTAAADIFIEGVEELLVAAFQNVLANAKHHADDPNPTIDVTDAGNGVVRVTVADNGPGVPHEAREQIFEPLTRLRSRDGAASASAENRKHDGFGLGLAIARSTVRAFGGDLTCRERRDGRSGAEFVFSLRKALSGPRSGEED